MRALGILILMIMPVWVQAQDWEDRQIFGSGETTLRVLSSTDTSFFAPIIADFIAINPSVSVEYFVTGTAQIDQVFRADPAAFDLVISSAMDLQLKLANDGFANRISGLPHPDWARWNNSVFAFTTEPAAIVVNRDSLTGLPVPRSRQDLIELMRANPDRFQGRVGTYDVRQSGLGYLFATQDARASETFWRLVEVMGRMDARLYCCSGEMIDDLIAGDLVVAYNVLGSYAQARSVTSDNLVVILPSEFPTTMMRTVLVSRQTSYEAVAEQFLRHILALAAARDPGRFPLPPLSDVDGPVISLNPALMTYLDQMKRETFIREWENAILQDE